MLNYRDKNRMPIHIGLKVVSSILIVPVWYVMVAVRIVNIAEQLQPTLCHVISIKMLAIYFLSSFMFDCNFRSLDVRCGHTDSSFL